MNTLPKWTEDKGASGRAAVSGFTCNDAGALALAIRCAFHGFNLPEYDLWLTAMPAKWGARVELLGRRVKAERAARANDHASFLRHLEWMQGRRREIERERFLLPLAQAHDKVRKGSSRSNTNRSDQAKMQRNALCQVLQPMADAIWKRNPRLSKKDVAREIYKKYPRKPGQNPPAVDKIRRLIERSNVR